MRITGKPSGSFTDGVEVEQVVLVRQRGLLQVGDVPAVGVLLDERLPLRAPGRRLAERAHDRGRDRAAVGIDPEIAAADEVEAGVIEVVVGPVVDRDALRRQPVPVVEVEREQRGDGRAGVVAEVVPADLAVLFDEPVGKRLRLRQQQHAHVLVGVAGEQHDLGGLEVFLAALDDSSTPARGRCRRRPRSLVTMRLRHDARAARSPDRLGDRASPRSSSWR